MYLVFTRQMSLLSFRFWSVSIAKCLHVMIDHKDIVSSVAVTRCGSKTISGSLDYTVKVWNTEQTSE